MEKINIQQNIVQTPDYFSVHSIKTILQTFKNKQQAVYLSNNNYLIFLRREYVNIHILLLETSKFNFPFFVFSRLSKDHRIKLIFIQFTYQFYYHLIMNLQPYQHQNPANPQNNIGIEAPIYYRQPNNSNMNQNQGPYQPQPQPQHQLQLYPLPQRQPYQYRPAPVYPPAPHLKPEISPVKLIVYLVFFIIGLIFYIVFLLDCKDQDLSSYYNSSYIYNICQVYKIMLIIYGVIGGVYLLINFILIACMDTSTLPCHQIFLLGRANEDGCSQCCMGAFLGIFLVITNVMAFFVFVYFLCQATRNQALNQPNPPASERNLAQIY